MSARFFTLFCFAFFSCFGTEAQTYIGLSVNFGNQIRYAPASPGLKTPAAVSGNIVLNVQERVSNGWAVQYGAAAGILGYNLKAIAIDTILTGEKFVFLEYATFYGNLHLVLGKEFLLKEKKLMLGLGGGGSYYYCPYPTTTYNVDVVFDDRSEKKIFHAEIYSPENKFAAFAKIVAQLKLSTSIIIGLEYSSHFKPALNGSYEFYHMKTPSAGKISLYQRELNVIFLVKVSRIRQ